MFYVLVALSSNAGENLHVKSLVTLEYIPNSETGLAEDGNYPRF